MFFLILKIENYYCHLLFFWARFFFFCFCFNQVKRALIFSAFDCLLFDFTGAQGGVLQYDPTLLKNKDADLFNPNLQNVYHTIDEMDPKKIEHVYDEIKQNGPDTEYDRLDYTRPRTTWKPHYHRMVNGIGTLNNGDDDDDNNSKPSTSTSKSSDDTKTDET